MYVSKSSSGASHSASLWMGVGHTSPKQTVNLVINDLLKDFEGPSEAMWSTPHNVPVSESFPECNVELTSEVLSSQPPVSTIHTEAGETSADLLPCSHHLHRKKWLMIVLLLPRSRLSRVIALHLRGETSSLLKLSIVSFLLITIDGISFHFKECFFKWKYVVHCCLVDESVISDQHRLCFAVIVLITKAGLLSTVTNLGLFYPKLV